MAPVRISIVPRDTTSPDPPKLDTGAIIGIACGTGALFLGSFVLFFIYWRRTRQSELEDAAPYSPHDLEENPFAASSPPAFTLDYKQSEKHPPASYSVPPELLKTDTRRLSPVGGFVSAMPTHPAYIPRTVIRGSTPQPTRSLTTTTRSRSLTPTTEEPDNLTPRSQTALLPAAPARSKSRPASSVVQAYLSAASGERVPSSLFRHAAASSSPPTTRALPLRTSSLARPPPPQLQINTTAPPARTRPRPPRGSPPRLNLEMGLERRRRPIAHRDAEQPGPPPPPPPGRSITKPLAVLPPQQPSPPAPVQQEQYYYPEPPAAVVVVVEDEPPSEDHRAFRDRADMVVVDEPAPVGRRYHHRRESSSTSRRIGDWIANSTAQGAGRRAAAGFQPQPPPSAGDDRLWS